MRGEVETPDPTNDKLEMIGRWGNIKSGSATA